MTVKEYEPIECQAYRHDFYVDIKEKVAFIVKYYRQDLYLIKVLDCLGCVVVK